MKTTMKRLTAIFAAVLLLAMTAVPALAKMTVDELTVSDHDAEKLSAFWHQPARDGMNNGELVYDTIRSHNWGTLTDYGPAFDPYSYYYEDGWETVLVRSASSFGISRFDFHLDYTEQFFGSAEDGDLFYQGYESVFPDLYGDLDLSGTAVFRLGVETENESLNTRTHITSVNLNDCENLSKVFFPAQPFCRSFEALNCPNLFAISLDRGALEHAAFSVKYSEEPLTIDALGLGHFGVNSGRTSSVLTAYPENGKFVGWFIDGECVSTALTYECEDAGEVVAYFGGDADGNGIIDTTDALLLLRSSLGVTEELDADIADVNNDGAVDTADALEILRYALGVR